MSVEYKIQMIVGSARANRIGRNVAEWAAKQIPASLGLKTELVDLADWTLPFSDEPNIPATGIYTSEYTLAWAKKVSAADGFIIVTAEYNAGYTACLKNALDHLYKEWNSKPVMVIGYGFHGGGRAAGQLRPVLANLRMRQTTITPQLTLTKPMLDANGQVADMPTAFAPYAESIAQGAAELTKLLQTPASPT